MENVGQYIEKHKILFWSVGESHRKDISKTLLVETILNYGTLEDCRELIALLGLSETAKIFFQNTQNKPRHNYYPEVENYFRHYFQRHAR